MGESQRVRSEEQELARIKGELANFLKSHLDANKMTPAETKKKASYDRQIRAQ